MKEQFDVSKVNELTNFLLDSLKGAKQLTVEQMPDIIQQIVLYKQISYTIGFVVTLVIGIFSSWHFVKGIKVLDKDESPTNVVKVTLGGLCGTISFATMLMFAFNTIAWFLAPKMQLLEYLRDFIK